MSLSFSDLVTPDTAEQALEALLAFLEAEGFPVTDWEIGSVPRTLTEGEANAYADACALIAAIAKGGFLDTSEGPWLTLLALAFYGLPRLGAVQTQGTFVLTDAGGGPHTVAIGDLIVSGPDVLTYRNLEAGEVPLNGALPMLFGAEALGAAYNLANGASLQLLTTLPTVVVTNPGTLGGSWISQQGADEESDLALRGRCKARWPGTTYMLSTAATYEAAARTASPEVTKVKVFPHTPSPGYVSVLIAGAAGAVSEAALDAVGDYLTDRLPLCVQLDLDTTTPLPIAVVAELQCEPAFAGTVQTKAEVALAKFQRECPIGGAPGGVSGYVYRAALVEVLMAVEGMINVNLSSPAGDTALASNELPSISSTLTVTPLA